MRNPLALLLGLLAGITVSAVAQTLTNTSDASTISSHALQAFSSTVVSQVDLSGTAKAYAGSLQPSGTFSATIKSTGESTLQLNLAELTRTETTGAYSSPPQCTWTGADGVQHSSAQHNCFLPVNWLLPIFTLPPQVSTLTQSMSSRTDQGIEVEALSLNQPAPDSSKAGRDYSQLSLATISLDTTTDLPTSLTFNLHPDNDSSTNIPIRVRYSDYRQVSGAMVPFHIQKYLNNGLILDLQVETAEVQ